MVLLREMPTRDTREASNYREHIRDYNSAVVSYQYSRRLNLHLEMVHTVSGYTAKFTNFSHLCIQTREISHYHHHHWQNSPFWAIAFIRKFCQSSLELDCSVFTSLDFATIIFLQSLESNPQPGGPGSCIYVPQWQGGPVICPGTGFPFRRLLRFVGLRWGYSNPPPHW
jgi:hypothetical protein